MNATTTYHPRDEMLRDDRRVAYADTRAVALITRAGDDDHRYDALAALIGECYPNSTWSN